MKGDLELGTPVSVAAVLTRDCDNTRRYWERLVLDTPLTGIVVGYRTRSNGRMWSEDTGYGRSRYYMASHFFQTMLVATSLRTSFEIVLPSDVTPCRRDT